MGANALVEVVASARAVIAAAEALSREQQRLAMLLGHGIAALPSDPVPDRLLLSDGGGDPIGAVRGRRKAPGMPDQGGECGVVGMRARRKGVVFGMVDAMDALAAGPASKEDLMKKFSGMLPDKTLRVKLCGLLSPSVHKGRIVRVGDEYRLSQRACGKKVRRGGLRGKARGVVVPAAECPGTGDAKEDAWESTKSAAASGQERLLEELGPVLREQLERGPLPMGRLANLIAPMFPLHGKKEVADAIAEVLAQSEFFQEKNGDWRRA